MRRLIYFIVGFILAFALVNIINYSDVEEEIIVSEIGNVKFIDVTSDVGIDYIQSTRKYKIDGQAYLRGDLQGLFSGGADVADYDNDGWLDLYVTRLDRSDILYRNVEGIFVDVTDDVGLNLMINSNKVRWVDVDNNGFDDLFVSVVGEKRNYLFRWGDTHIMTHPLCFRNKTHRILTTSPIVTTHSNFAIVCNH